jgi:GNAT superfamily N-acetyltransferase
MVRNATWQEVRHLVRASYEEQGIGASPSPAHCYLAYEEDGEVVACQGWRNIGWLYAELCHLYVMPSHRKKGIAKKLQKCGFKVAGACSSPVSGRTLMVFVYVKTE